MSKFQAAHTLYHSNSERSPKDLESCLSLLAESLLDPVDHVAHQSDAIHLMGICHVDMGEKEKAVELWEKAARLGNNESKYRLAECFFYGDVYPQDQSKAFKIFQKLAKKGNIWAQYMAADCFENGTGTEIDMAQAIFWYRRSAESGHEFAELQLKVIMDEDAELPADLIDVTAKLDEELEALEAAGAAPKDEEDGDDDIWEQ